MVRVLTVPVMRAVVLITALLLWVNLSALASRPVALLAPLLVTGLESGLAVADIVIDVETKISGSAHALGQVSSSSFNFILDLSDIDSIGRYSREIKLSHIPSGVELISADPQVIVFDVDVQLSKVVPALVKTVGQVADNYSVENVTVAPDRVTILGAARMLDKISDVKAYVQIGGRKSTFLAPAEFVAEDAANRSIRTVQVVPAIGTITVNVKPGAAWRSLGLQPTLVNQLPGGFWIQEIKFEPPVVTVWGNQRVLDELRFLVTTPINLDGKTATFYDRVAVDLPHGVEMVEENLILAQVIIGSAQGTRQISVVPRYINVTEGFGVTTITPASVQVVLSGDPDKINGVRRSDVTLDLDLQGTLSGANTILIGSAMFTTSEGIDVVSFTPQSVEVVLSRLE